jgi:hypothetical protein
MVIEPGCDASAAKDVPATVDAADLDSVVVEGEFFEANIAGALCGILDFYHAVIEKPLHCIRSRVAGRGD